MSKRALWFCLACVLLAGCAAMEPRIERKAKKLDCESGNECTVTIDVSCSRFYGCTLALDHDLILVKGRGKRTDITWQLAGESGAEFPANGIVVDSAEFECKPNPEKKKAFGCSDKHADFGVSKYTINVTLPSTAFGPRGVPSLDPWIVND